MITVNSTLSYERQTVPPIIPAVQGDTGRNISFKIVDATIPEGATATFYIQKPSGNAVYNTAEIISSNQVLVPLDAQCLAEVGENFGQVRILLDDEVITSFDFILLVKVFHGIEAIESTTEMNIFDQAVEEAIEEIGNTLDTTLTLANKAAEAKAVGDALQWDVSKYNRPRISRGTGQDSTKENLFTEANGMASHAEGISTKANGIAAHTEGSDTIAGSDFQHVFGKYNIEDTNNTYVEIVGNGVADAGRNNARTLDWQGNEVLWGDLTIFRGFPNETSISSLKNEIEDISMYTLGLYPQKSVADVAVASFADGADDIPVKSLTVDITPVQSGSGDPSPSNVRPISGWTGANVTRTGGSLIRIARTANTVNGITFSENSDGTVHLSGSSTAEALSSNTIVSYPDIDTRCYYTVPAGTYTLTNLSSSASVRVYVQFRNASNTENVINNQTVAGGASYTFTVSEPTIVYARVDIYSGTTVNADVLFMMTKGSSAATVYEPWKQTIYPITFPTSAGTVYGGTLDVTNGVLTVTYGYVDLGTLSIGYQSSGTYFYATIASKAYGISNITCSKYATSTDALLSNMGNNKIRGHATSNNIYIKDFAYTDATAFKASLSGVQAVFELATPVTYQLTPTEVTTLLRNNNIFADTGNVAELTYRADLKAYIDEKLA